MAVKMRKSITKNIASQIEDAPFLWSIEDALFLGGALINRVILLQGEAEVTESKWSFVTVT
ncbi:hypothetical protein L0Z72_07400 [candidate division KSB1 bacterium]|nr:hypothetical protein [candidate division KSB1 bacterium]